MILFVITGIDMDGVDPIIEKEATKLLATFIRAIENRHASILVKIKDGKLVLLEYSEKVDLA